MSAGLGLETRILYRDGLMLVLDKPAGLPVHAGPKGGPNLEQGFDALRFGLPQAPGLAHRLDRDTSGCLVLGRHRKALARLGRLFAAGRVEKTYWAVAQGAPPQAAGRIDLALAKRSTAARGWWMKPRTGRTHQLRVHCAELGCPILGDAVYGRPDPAGRALHLHARRIVVPLYPDRAPVVVEAPSPAHMNEALAACGLRAPPEGVGRGAG